jgi:UDP-N-acetyl-D-mannosaminuronate dehydrogenase
VEIAERLRERGATVVVHDPCMREHAGDVGDRVAHADALVLAVAHPEYRALDLASLGSRMARRVLVDARGIVTPEAATRAGFIFRAVGRGDRVAERSTC